MNLSCFCWLLRFNDGIVYELPTNLDLALCLIKIFLLFLIVTVMLPKDLLKYALSSSSSYPPLANVSTWSQVNKFLGTPEITVFISPLSKFKA